MTRPPRQLPTTDEIADVYDAAAARYDLNHSQTRRAGRFRRVDAPLQRVAARADGGVLEIGCGTGRLLSSLHGKPAVGVDLSARSLEYARARGLAVARADAHALPFEAGRFSAVVSGNGSFRYLDYGAAFREVARVLEPGGELAIHQYGARCWNPRRFWRAPAGDTPLHVYAVEELIEPAAEAGLIATELYRWRTLRTYPYVIPIPAFVRAPIWSHVVVVYRKEDSDSGQ